MPKIALLPREVVARSANGTWYLESPHRLADPPGRLGDLLRRAAERTPDRDFLVEREGTGLRRVSYAAALRAAEAIASYLLDDGRGDRPVVALSGNSVDHALLMLGCFLAGVPIAPVSPAYSLLSRDFAKLRQIAAKVRPRVVFADARGPFEPALAAIDRAGTTFVDGARLREIARGPVSAELRAREARIGLDDVAKILFTSGSTGFPKGVPNTHRMLVANQQMIAQLWPFLEEQPPVLVDWLPWSHTFGANHNFNMALFHGGTFFVDQGKPTEALIGKTLENLRELPPTIYFNVPAGFAALVPRLEADDDLRRAFFSRLRVVFYAAAALPDDLWQRLRRLAERAGRDDVFLTTAWGSTETAPLATSAHFELERAGNIGLPAPGVTLKLVPNGRKLEVRVKGPNVMREYFEEPELTRTAFDDEGFYRIGDAVRFANAADPSEGLLFDGRVAEDFKLMTGTWVSVSTIRVGVLAEAAPVLGDLVVAGQDRAELGVLAWPSPAGCRSIAGGETDPAALARSAAVRGHVRAAVARWNAAHPETSTRIARVLLLEEPASIDAGEVTDKGYVNQRATLERRSALVDALFADRPNDDVIVVPSS